MNPVVADPISTPRLVLLPLRVEHAAEMADVLGDPALHAFIGGKPLAFDDLRARYERLVAGSPEPGESWGNWVIQLRDSGALAGTVQATIRGDDPMAAEIAWVVGTAWQGQGIATEAARALVDWLGRQGVQVVVAHVHPDHQASAAVAAAAGLSPTDEQQDGETRWRHTLTP